MPALPSQAAAVPIAATIHDAQNADQKRGGDPRRDPDRGVDQQRLPDQTGKNDREPANAGSHQNEHWPEHQPKQTGNRCRHRGTPRAPAAVRFGNKASARANAADETSHTTTSRAMSPRRRPVRG